MALFSNNWIKRLKKIMDALQEHYSSENPNSIDTTAPNPNAKQTTPAYRKFVEKSSKPLDPDEVLVKDIRKILVNADLHQKKNH